MRTSLLISVAIAGLVAGTSFASAQSSPGQTPGQRAEEPTGPDSGRLQPGMHEPGSPAAGEGQSSRLTTQGIGRTGDESTRSNATGANSPGASPAQTPGQRAEQPQGPDSGHTPPGSSGTR
jgi:hypothetical protein